MMIGGYELTLPQTPFLPRYSFFHVIMTQITNFIFVLLMCDPGILPGDMVLIDHH